jgi:hypothetical protein
MAPAGVWNLQPPFYLNCFPVKWINYISNWEMISVIIHVCITELGLEPRVRNCLFGLWAATNSPIMKWRQFSTKDSSELPIWALNFPTWNKTIVLICTRSHNLRRKHFPVKLLWRLLQYTILPGETGTYLSLVQGSLASILPLAPRTKWRLGCVELRCRSGPSVPGVYIPEYLLLLLARIKPHCYTTMCTCFDETTYLSFESTHRNEIMRIIQKMLLCPLEIYFKLSQLKIIPNWKEPLHYGHFLL